MPASRAEFQVHIKSTSENAGLEKSIGSHKELHEALLLVKQSAGQALGPVGELAHFLANPSVLAVEGATLAIKMLVEQHEKLRAEMEKNIQATREVREAFAGNYESALRQVAESTAQFQRALLHAGESENRFAADLSAQTALIQEQASSLTSLATARLALYQANIQGGLLTGELTGPEANDANEHARIQARQQQEEIDRATRQREIHNQLAAAAAARTESNLLTDQATSQNRTDQRVRNIASVQDLQDEVERRKPNASATGELADRAKAEAVLLGPRPTAQQEAGANQQLLESVGQPGDVPAAAQNILTRAEAWKKYDLALKDHQTALEQVKKAEDLLAAAKVRQQDFDEETRQLQNRAVQLRTFAEETERAARAQESLNEAMQSDRRQVDAIQDQTAQQTRRNFLEERHQHGQLTADEGLEYQGAFSAQPARDTAQITARIHQLENAIRAGRGNAEVFAELHRLMDSLIGLVENTLDAGERSQTLLHALESRVRNLESRQNYGHYPGGG
jgi:hypothetical protein